MELKLGMKVKRFDKGSVYEVTGVYAKYLTNGEKVKINVDNFQGNEFRITKVVGYKHVHRYMKLSDIYSVVQSDSYRVYAWQNKNTGHISTSTRVDYGDRLNVNYSRLESADQIIQDFQEKVL